MLLIIIFSLFCTIISYITFGQIRALPVIFNSWWTIIFIMFYATQDNYYPLKSNVLNLILLGLLSVNCACIFYKIIIGEKRFTLGGQKEYRLYDDMHESICRLVYRVQIIFLILLIPMFLKALPTVLAGGFGEMRSVYVGFSGEAIMSTLERIVYIHFIVFPGVNACTLLQAIFWSKGQMPIRKLWVAVINVILVTFITGARSTLFAVIIYLSAAFVVNSDVIKNLSKAEYKNKKRIIILTVIASICAFIYITSQRSMGYGRSIKENFFDTISTYFSGGIKLFDYTLSSPHDFGLGEYLFGLAFIAGILSVFQLVLMYFPVIGGIFSGDLLSNQIQHYVAGYYHIGPQISMNAFPTMFYYFMRDFGILGIILGSAIFGWIIAWATIRVRNNELSSCIVYCITCFLVIYSVCWWDPYRMEFWTTIGIVALLVNISRKRTRKGKR